MRNIFLCIAILCFPILAKGQAMVSGKISDTDQKPLQSVEIRQHGTSFSVLSNEFGEFSLPVEALNGFLEFTKIGFISEKIGLTESYLHLNMKRIEEVALQDLSLEDLLNATVEIASKNIQTQEEAPSILSVVSQRELELYGARDISDVLRMIPGFEFGVDVSGLAGLFFRGMWGHEGKVLLMMDGVILNDLAYGNYNFIGSIPVSMVSKIEIIRGPGSAIYGGFAEVAVINVITRKGNELKNGNWQAGSGVLSKSFTHTGNMSYGLQKDSNHLSIHVGFSQGALSNKNYTDYHQSVLPMDNESFGRNWVHLISHAKFKDMRFTYNRNTFSFLGQDWYGYILPPINKVYSAHYKHYNESAKLSYVKQKKAWYFEPSIDFTRGNPFASANLPVFDSLGQLLQPFHKYQNASILLSRWQYQMVVKYEKHGWNLMSGGGYITDKAYGYSIIGTPAYQLSSNPKDTSYQAQTHSAFLFIQGEKKWAHGNITAGTRFESTSFGNAVAPRLGFTYFYQSFNAKLLVGQAYRIPMPWQAYSRRWPPIEGNGLEAEITRTIETEVGYKINKNTRLKLNAYSLSILNKIWFVPDAYINQKTVMNTMGIEGDLQVRYANFGGFTNFSYCIPVKSSSSDASLVVDKQNKPFAIIGFPAVKINAGAYYLYKKISLSAHVNYLSPRYSQNPQNPGNNQQYVKNKAVFLLHSRLGADLYKGLKGFISVSNILNANYELIQAYFDYHAPLPANDRETRIGLEWSF